MKNIMPHILSILLILVLAVLTISTSRPPPKTVFGRLAYETHDGYLIIKIEAEVRMNYEDYSSVYIYLVDFEGYETQYFRYYYEKAGKTGGRLYTRDGDTGYIEIEEVEQDTPFFEIAFEDKFILIKLKEELIKYDNYRVDAVDLFYNPNWLLLTD